MRKINFIALVCCTFLMFSCAASAGERNMRSLQAFTTELQAEYASYTDEDWDKALAEFDEIVTEIDQAKLTDEQLREVGRLKGQCLAIFSKRAMEVSGKVLEKTLIEAEGLLKGFLESIE